jgi:undecaprenyl-diphosphatase
VSTTAAIYHMNYLQAVVIGLIQGISELFPVSSLGHTVLIPSWIGGTWATLVSQESQAESPYLSFIVGLHLATAVVLLGFFAREWARLLSGFVRSLGRRRIARPEERLAWLIVIATVPVGILGVVFEHQFRVLFAKPLAAALFLMLNGVILFAGEAHMRRSSAAAGGAAVPGAVRYAVGPDAVARNAVPTREGPGAATARSGSATGAGGRVRDRIAPLDGDAERELSRVGMPSAGVIGASQALALLAGISREGVAMVGGLYRGLDRENAMRFAFLLSTPVILAAGALKVPDLVGSLGNGIHGQVVAGSLAAAASSLFAVVFLTRWFVTRTLVPFAVYSLLFGLASAIRFGAF